VKMTLADFIREHHAHCEPWCKIKKAARRGADDEEIIKLGKDALPDIEELYNRCIIQKI